MKFIREIPSHKITNRDLALEQEGFTLVWKEDSVEIWAEVYNTAIRPKAA